LGEYQLLTIGAQDCDPVGDQSNGVANSTRSLK